MSPLLGLFLRIDCSLIPDFTMNPIRLEDDSSRMEVCTETPGQR